MTTTLATSNLRSSSRQVRANPIRTSKLLEASLRQSSTTSNPIVAPSPLTEPHGFYPAIQHFADAISALPRDFRRHTSLLKEVDAKAWSPEEHLQALLTRCLEDPSLRSNTFASARRDGPGVSTQQQPHGANADSRMAHDATSSSPLVQSNAEQPDGRRLYTSLRQTLMQMMITMDEKNHVINNANEELSRHIRRLDSVYPRIAEEVSEEARLGSLKHWAFFETNITKKVQSTRREAAASLAIMHENEVARRSENRREAMLANKRHKLNQVQADSDVDDGKHIQRKKLEVTKAKRPLVDMATDLPIPVNVPKRKKNVDKTLPGLNGPERALGSALGGRPMSREPSQQDGVSNKRKAPTSTGGAARKRYATPKSGSYESLTNTYRLNVNANDSPKLVSSPLAGNFGKEAYKRSPIPSAARPSISRGRQNSNHLQEGVQPRTSSNASTKLQNKAHASTGPDPQSLGASHDGPVPEMNHTAKKPQTAKGDLAAEDTVGTGNSGGREAKLRAGIPLERSSSRSGVPKRDISATENHVSTRSPRLPPPIQTSIDRAVRGRASKTSTPVTGTFADASSFDSLEANTIGSTHGGNGNGKAKRPARPRIKDHHGLQDSLSPKALPPKRSHKKGGSISGPFPEASQSSITSKILLDEEFKADSPTPEATNLDHEAADAVLDEDEFAEEGEDEGEERYCYCNGVSYGEMVACDNKDCKREWFHLECAGLRKAPGDKGMRIVPLTSTVTPTNLFLLAKWYCEECKELLVKKGRLGSGSNGSGAIGLGIADGNGHGNGSKNGR